MILSKRCYKFLRHKVKQLKNKTILHYGLVLTTGPYEDCILYLGPHSANINDQSGKYHELLTRTHKFDIDKILTFLEAGAL